jgi:hypothetical protein
LGLAVIERWTYYLLTAYKERIEKNNTNTTTLHDIMVAPFASASSSPTSNVNMLAAQVGIDDHTSNRKFQDVLLSEFFGETKYAGGNDFSVTTIDDASETMVNVMSHENTKISTNIEINFAEKRLLDDITSPGSTDNNPLHDWAMMGLTTNETRDNSCGSNDWNNYHMVATSWISGMFLLLLTLGMVTTVEKKLCRL